MVQLNTSANQADSSQGENSNRRGSGQRARARDRLMDRANTAYKPHPSLTHIRHVENLLLFIDDDLRESALSMERIERYLVSTLELLEGESLPRRRVEFLAGDTEVLDQIDQLNASLESLRRRMARLAGLL